MPPQDTHRPSFSFIICNFNYAGYLGKAVDSCLNQDYPPDLVQVVVVDDGSTDESLEVLDAYRHDPRVTVVSQKNAGHAAAYATGVRHVSGDFVCLLDADDYPLPHKLDKLASFMAGLAPLPEMYFLCHDLHLLDEQTGKVAASEWFAQMGVGEAGESLSLRRLTQVFPFATPAGMVFSRPLLERLMAGIPLTDWRMGVDTPLGHGAMCISGQVHLLHEPLAVYVLHPGNSGTRLIQGEYRPKPNWRSQWPRLLRYLELLVDGLELEDAQRQERLAYLKRLERAARSSSALHRTPQPGLSFILVRNANPEELDLAMDAVANQTHDKVELVVVGQAAAPAPSASRVREIPLRAPLLESEAGHLDRFRVGLQAATGHYVTFLQAGAVPDPTFAERHLFLHTQVGLAAVTACDIRLLGNDGSLLHEAVFANSGAWPQALEQRRPAAGSPLNWPFPALAATVMRRDGLLDLLFETVRDHPPPDGDGVAVWLMLQFAHAVGGSLRFRETLMSLQAPLRYGLGTPGTPTDDTGKPVSLPFPELVEWLFRFFCLHHSHLRARLGDPWAVRYLAWLLRAKGPSAATLRHLARLHAADPGEVNRLLDAANRQI